MILSSKKVDFALSDEVNYLGALLPLTSHHASNKIGLGLAVLAFCPIGWKFWRILTKNWILEKKGKIDFYKSIFMENYEDVQIFIYPTFSHSYLQKSIKIQLLTISSGKDFLCDFKMKVILYLSA